MWLHLHSVWSFLGDHLSLIDGQEGQAASVGEKDVVAAVNHCSYLVSNSIGPYRYLKMRERLRIRAVDRSLLDLNCRVIPFIAMIGWMNFFALSMSANPGTVFSLS